MFLVINQTLWYSGKAHEAYDLTAYHYSHGILLQFKLGIMLSAIGLHMNSRQRSQKQRDPPQELQENGEEEEELDEEGEMMKKIMGFSHFDSTKVQRQCVR